MGAELYFVLAVWAVVMAYLLGDYRGWMRGFDASRTIWKTHAEDMTKLWRGAAERAWAELKDRSV